ncbi:MAG: hypothetical protein K0S01_1293 [Herbinix sp.]|jgi:energy-coupling factor transport system substrate-specific component|nr:hypothetical protein [Herbinix sp.]
MRIKDIVIIGMMGAIMFVLQVALRFIPNIELVSLLIIIYTLIFGRKTIYIIYVFVVIEGLLYGLGLWWFNYLYVWTVLFLITLLLRKQRSPFLWAIVSGFYGLGFGALCSIPYFITSGVQSGFAYWIAGIPYDIPHGIGNFVIALILFHPIYYILDKINKRMEFM